MATCKQADCNKKAFGTEDFCTTHRPKPASSSSPVYVVLLARASGSTKVNQTFESLANKKTPAEPYKQRIEHLRSTGPSNGSTENVHGVYCLHDTQKSNNVTVWYSWNENTITIWGLGSHTGGNGSGNDKYTMTWFDGTSKNWSRA